MRKTSRTFNQKLVRVLANKDAAGQLIIPMADGVQYCFSDNALIKCWNVKDKKAFLIMLSVVTQID